MPFLVRALLIASIVVLGSAKSVSADAASTDAPPGPVLAWRSGDAIRVVWERTTDLQRFHVYRSTSDGTTWIPLTPTPYADRYFLDRCDEPVLPIYRVVALDDRGNETTISADTLRHAGIADAPYRTAAESSTTPDATAAFDKNTIISDGQLSDYLSMDVDAIQAFLSAHNGPLASFSTGGRTAAQIIFDECQLYQINPRAVLSTLEKEMSLITRAKADPNYCAMGWNSCKSVNDFAGQLHAGTRQFRLFLDDIGKYADIKGNPWTVNQVRYVSDGTVSPTTVATAGLYAYTPWIGGPTGVGGNYSFWNLWYNTFQFGFGITPRLDPEVTDLQNTVQTVSWFYIAIGNPLKWYIVEATDPFASDAAVMLLKYADPSFSGGIRWKPINNYPSYAGFPGAGAKFTYVTPSFDGESVAFGRLTSPETDPDISALENTVQDVRWYYFATVSPMRWYIVDALNPFTTDAAVLLLKRIDANFSGGIRWKPINNYVPYADYPAAGYNFAYVTTSFDGRSVYFGEFADANSMMRAETLGHVIAPSNVLSALPRNSTGVVPPGVSCFAITPAAQPSAGGTARVVSTANCATGFSSGSAVAITSSSNSGYTFSRWSASNCALGDASQATTTCTMNGEGNANVTAVFSPVFHGSGRRRAVGR